MWGGGGVLVTEKEMKYCRLVDKGIPELYPARAVSTWARLGSRSGPTAGSSTESSTVSMSAQFKTEDSKCKRLYCSVKLFVFQHLFVWNERGYLT
jgi:hypothetical protein